jgi:hypothetical protein
MNRLIEILLLTTMAFSLLAGLAAGEVKLIKGQTIYVPCYTSFMSGSHADSHAFEAKPTVFIHNTDQKNPINIVRIDFYNTDGKLWKNICSSPKNSTPMLLPGLTSRNF